MDDSVSASVIVDVLTRAGGSARADAEHIYIYPNGGAPRVYVLVGGALRARLVIEIAKRFNLPTHWFWHPDEAVVGQLLRGTNGTEN